MFLSVTLFSACFFFLSLAWLSSLPDGVSSGLLSSFLLPEIPSLLTYPSSQDVAEAAGEALHTGPACGLPTGSYDVSVTRGLPKS